MSGTNDNKKEINILDFLTSNGAQPGSTGGVGLKTETLLEWIKSTHEKLNSYDELLERYKTGIKSLADNYDQHAKEIKDLRDDVNEQRNRIPEVVGIFSAIIAIVLIDVSVIKSAESFLAAILLIVGLTCTVSIFAILIHGLFAKGENAEGEKVKPNSAKYFWIPMTVQIILLIVGTYFYYTGGDLYSVRSMPTNTNASTTISVPLNAVSQ